MTKRDFQAAEYAAEEASTKKLLDGLFDEICDDAVVRRVAFEHIDLNLTVKEVKPRTIRVRAVAAVNPDNRWCVCGWLKRDGKLDTEECVTAASEGLDDDVQICWIEADIPVYRDEPTIEGRCVEDARTNNPGKNGETM